MLQRREDICNVRAILIPNKNLLLKSIWDSYIATVNEQLVCLKTGKRGSAITFCASNYSNFHVSNGMMVHSLLLHDKRGEILKSDGTKCNWFNFLKNGGFSTKKLDQYFLPHTFHFLLPFNFKHKSPIIFRWSDLLVTVSECGRGGGVVLGCKI